MLIPRSSNFICPAKLMKSVAAMASRTAFGSSVPAFSSAFWKTSPQAVAIALWYDGALPQRVLKAS